MRGKRIAFVGSSLGMTDLQKSLLREQLKLLRTYAQDPSGDVHGYEADDFLHDDSLGSTVEACKIALSLGYRLVAYPCKKGAYRALIFSNFSYPAVSAKERFETMLLHADWFILAPRSQPRCQRTSVKQIRRLIKSATDAGFAISHKIIVFPEKASS